MKLNRQLGRDCNVVASSREDAWIETAVTGTRKEKKKVASSGDACGLKQETGAGNIRIFPKYAWIGIKCQVFCLDLLNFNEYKTKKEGDH